MGSHILQKIFIILLCQGDVNIFLFAYAFFSDYSFTMPNHSLRLKCTVSDLLVKQVLPSLYLKNDSRSPENRCTERQNLYFLHRFSFTYTCIRRDVFLFQFFFFLQLLLLSNTQTYSIHTYTHFQRHVTGIILLWREMGWEHSQALRAGLLNY